MIKENENLYLFDEAAKVFPEKKVDRLPEPNFSEFIFNVFLFSSSRFIFQPTLLKLNHFFNPFEKNLDNRNDKKKKKSRSRSKKSRDRDRRSDSRKKNNK